MGAAKQRGTREQRVEQAREQAIADMEARKNELEAMDALEQRQNAALSEFMGKRILPQMEKQYGALMRTDFSSIPLQMLKSSFEENA